MCGGEGRGEVRTTLPALSVSLCEGQGDDGGKEEEERNKRVLAVKTQRSCRDGWREGSVEHLDEKTKYVTKS